jgi:uncharacterized protein YecE (DUF72 family)
VSPLSLFDEPLPLRERLAPALKNLAGEGVFLGTSSWKYEGWIGQIYSESRYRVRGRFSQRAFAETCLAEYAETFPVVCGDFSFYQFPTEQFWAKLFSSAPASLRFALKVPEDITVKTFPQHARYGPRAGEENPGFLDAFMLEEMFLVPLAPYRDRVALLIFEFGSFPRGLFDDAAGFAEPLDAFLAALPDGFRYAVEVRNQAFLAADYFDTLRGRGVAHVFNAWSRMPELGAQTALDAAYTADFTVTRALLRQGRTYEQAVAYFQPYREIRDPNPEARKAIGGLIARARARRQPAYIFVNNRLEGNAPLTIDALIEEVDLPHPE